jgi:glycerate 2-kinase
VRIVAAPDKFRGTASAGEIAGAVARAAAERGATCVEVPMSDGGEGMLDALGGGNRELTVTGPVGDPVVAPWRLGPDGLALIEGAHACGIALVGGPAGNDPEAATTRGVGELIVAAARAGADRVIVGAGGSATTDGGAGAVEVITAAGLGGLHLTVCCDVTTRFTDAARVFGPQKGADVAQVLRLTARLHAERRRILAATGIDLDQIPGSGAAGGLAGGLAALGAELVPGLEAIAGARSLEDAVAVADLVVTGEGRLDRTSLDGKVVGGVIGLARRHGVSVLVVVGQADEDVAVADAVTVVDLSARFGSSAARTRTTDCVTTAVAEYLSTCGRYRTKSSSNVGGQMS